MLGVTPAETAQTVSDFTAALNQTRIALSGEGTYQGVAAAAKFESLTALAERLRGLRSDKVLTVGFEGSSKVRVRFQPRQVADIDARRDEDSISRMLTATVLVRRDQHEAGRSGALRARTRSMCRCGRRGPRAVPSRTRSDGSQSARISSGRRREPDPDRRVHARDEAGIRRVRRAHELPRRRAPTRRRTRSGRLRRRHGPGRPPPPRSRPGPAAATRTTSTRRGARVGRGPGVGKAREWIRAAAGPTCARSWLPSPRVRSLDRSARRRQTTN